VQNTIEVIGELLPERIVQVVLIFQKRRRLGRPDRTRVKWATRDAVDEQEGKEDDAEIGRNEGRQPSKQKTQKWPAASRIRSVHGAARTTS